MGRPRRRPDPTPSRPRPSPLAGPRARHYGAIAKDALALFPESESKAALIDVVDFCVARAH